MEHNKRNTSRRPKEVSDTHFQSEWDRIFGKKDISKEDKKEIKKQLEDNEELSYKG